MLEPSTRCLSRPTAENLWELARGWKYHSSASGENPRNKLRLSAEQFDSYFKFTFVRNPWARAYSWYKAMCRDDYLREMVGVPPRATLGDALRSQMGRDMLRPQLHWILDYSGRVGMDFVGRFERLGADFGYVASELGLTSKELPHEIRGSGADYREQFDTESIDLVARFYAEEIELFGYRFGD